MVKFSARSDSKNFPHRNRLSRSVDVGGYQYYIYSSITHSHPHPNSIANITSRRQVSLEPYDGLSKSSDKNVEAFKDFTTILAKGRTESDFKNKQAVES
jgi:hypothetical protein